MQKPKKKKTFWKCLLYSVMYSTFLLLQEFTQSGPYYKQFMFSTTICDQKVQKHDHELLEQSLKVK
jgi:hypothetical protein